VTRDGRVSSWTHQPAVRVIGKATPPPDIAAIPAQCESFYLALSERPIDFAGFASVIIQDPIPIGLRRTRCMKGYWTTDYIDVQGLYQGDYTVMVKAVDTVGNESVEAASMETTFFLSDVPEIVIYTKDYRSIGFYGSPIHCSVDQASGDLWADICASLEIPRWTS
jgi:hypothetical protein